MEKEKSFQNHLKRKREEQKPQSYAKGSGSGGTTSKGKQVQGSSGNSPHLVPLVGSFIGNPARWDRISSRYGTNLHSTL